MTVGAAFRELSFDPRDCEEFLRTSFAVAEVAMLPRPDGTHTVYVVPTASRDRNSLERALNQRYGDNSLQVVLLSQLPRSPEGEIEVERLLQFPALTPATCERVRCDLLEAGVAAEPEVVLVEPEAHRWHLDDLLPAAASESNRAAKSFVELDLVTSALINDENLAMVSGVPLTNQNTLPENLASVLERAATASPDHGIRYVGRDGSESRQTYAELLHDARRVAAGLIQRGAGPDDKVVLLLDDLSEFVPAFWGCVVAGVVPVPSGVPSEYDPDNAGVKKLLKVLEVLSQPLVVSGSASAAALAGVMDASQAGASRLVTLAELRGSEQAVTVPRSSGDLALLLLTSGSTGIPKLVMLTHHAIIFQEAATAQHNRFSCSDVSLNWFPLDHVGGLVMFHVRDVFLACEQIHAPTDLVLKQPLLWLDWIDRFRATITWAPNFAFALVASHAEEVSKRCWDLSCMRFILSGGEAVVRRVTQGFLQLLAPHGLKSDVMHPAWGMSETCSGVVYSDQFDLRSDDSEEVPVEVGTPIPGVRLRVTDLSSGEVTKQGSIGALEVSGPCVTIGYYENQRDTAAATTADGWLKTGDLAVIKNDRLSITGRHKDVIIINGLNHQSQEIEALVERVEGVRSTFSAAFAVRRANDSSDRLAIVFSVDEAHAFERAEVAVKVRETVIRELAIVPECVVPVDPTEIPKTAIGKIQRFELRSRLMDGRYDTQQREVDVLLGKSNTLPDWFYRKAWILRPIASGAESPAGRTLVFVDQKGLWEALAHQGHLRRAIRVEVGASFERVADEHFRIRPHVFEDYEKLIRQAQVDGELSAVLNLWSYCPFEGFDPSEYERRVQAGVGSLLMLTNALIATGRRRRTRILVAARHVCRVRPDDTVAFERAATLGLARAANLEHPWLSISHIDLEGADVHADARAVHAELSQDEPEVALRDGCRFVARLRRVDFACALPGPLPIKAGGLYLITGGLGGVGAELARHLLERYEVQLLLVGRSSLSGVRGAPHAIEDDASLRLAERFATLRNLQSVGRVEYRAVDVADEVALRGAIAEVERALNSKFEGVFHLASELCERPLTELDEASLCSALRAKVVGSWVLDRVLAESKGALYVAFGSVTSFFGGSHLAAYSAACSAQSAFAEWQEQADRPYHHYALNYSRWLKLGMGARLDDVDLLESRGFFAMSATQGIASCLVALTRLGGLSHIGLNEASPFIRKWIDGSSVSLESLEVHVAAATGKMPPLFDLFGTPIPFLCRAARARSELLPTPVTHRLVADTAAATKMLTALWKRVLDLDRVQSHENFFDLGGHSLLIPKIQDAVKVEFGVDLQIVDIFRHTTIDALAKHLSCLKSTSQSVPRSEREVQHQIGRIWQELLELDQVEVDENFFDLGGHSLLIPRLQDRIEEELGVRIGVIQVFKHPTLSTLATYVTAVQGGRAAEEPPTVSAAAPGVATTHSRSAVAARQRALRQGL